MVSINLYTYLTSCRTTYDFSGISGKCQESVNIAKQIDKNITFLYDWFLHMVFGVIDSCGIPMHPLPIYRLDVEADAGNFIKKETLA